MILPIINQECIVPWKDGNLHLGTVRKAGVNWEKKYRIEVWSYTWGYSVEFHPDDVELLPVRRMDGTLYDARFAYRQKYSREEQQAHIDAEANQRQTNTSVLARVEYENPARKPPPPTRMVREDKKPEPVPYDGIGAQSKTRPIVRTRRK